MKLLPTTVKQTDKKRRRNNKVILDFCYLVGAIPITCKFKTIGARKFYENFTKGDNHSGLTLQWMGTMDTEFLRNCFLSIYPINICERRKLLEPFRDRDGGYQSKNHSIPTMHLTVFWGNLGKKGFDKSRKRCSLQKVLFLLCKKYI